MRAALLITVLALAPAARAASCHLPAAHEHFGGQVVAVHDGDTITLQTPSCAALHVRLADFDAYELSQRPMGQEARQVLASIALGHPTRCIVTKGRAHNYRSYGRAMATCWVAGVTLGDAMRAHGIEEGGR